MTKIMKCSASPPDCRVTLMCRCQMSERENFELTMIPTTPKLVLSNSQFCFRHTHFGMSCSHCNLCLQLMLPMCSNTVQRASLFQLQSQETAPWSGQGWEALMSWNECHLILYGPAEGRGVRRRLQCTYRMPRFTRWHRTITYIEKFPQKHHRLLGRERRTA